jgi:hypothetical protein
MSRALSAGLKTNVRTVLVADPKRIKPTGERQGKQLTLNLLVLRLEGGTRGGNCLLQLEDDIILLLVGLPQVLLGHARLDQLTGEPCDLLVQKLDGSLHRLKRSALPLNMALRFLSGRAFALEGGLSLLEGRPLLLELSLRLLVRTLLLTELLPHRGKRGGLVRQINPSCSASLAFSLAWLCQDCAPSRVAWSCWS